MLSAYRQPAVGEPTALSDGGPTAGRRAGAALQHSIVVVQHPVQGEMVVSPEVLLPLVPGALAQGREDLGEHVMGLAANLVDSFVRLAMREPTADVPHPPPLIAPVLQELVPASATTGTKVPKVNIKDFEQPEEVVK